MKVVKKVPQAAEEPERRWGKKRLAKRLYTEEGTGGAGGAGGRRVYSNSMVLRTKPRESIL